MNARSREQNLYVLPEELLNGTSRFEKTKRNPYSPTVTLEVSKSCSQSIAQVSSQISSMSSRSSRTGH